MPEHDEASIARLTGRNRLSGGTAVAVVASGAERAYPAGHRELIETIVDDNIVQLFTIEPDRSYAYEELHGLNYGWSKYDECGKEIYDGENEGASSSRRDAVLHLADILH